MPGGRGTAPTFKLPDLRDRALYGAGRRSASARRTGRDSARAAAPRHNHYFRADHGHGAATTATMSGSPRWATHRTTPERRRWRGAATTRSPISGQRRSVGGGSRPHARSPERANIPQDAGAHSHACSGRTQLGRSPHTLGRSGRHVRRVRPRQALLRRDQLHHRHGEELTAARCGNIPSCGLNLYKPMPRKPAPSQYLRPKLPRPSSRRPQARRQPVGAAPTRLAGYDSARAAHPAATRRRAGLIAGGGLLGTGLARLGYVQPAAATGRESGSPTTAALIAGDWEVQDAEAAMGAGMARRRGDFQAGLRQQLIDLGISDTSKLGSLGQVHRQRHDPEGGREQVLGRRPDRSRRRSAPARRTTPRSPLAGCSPRGRRRSRSRT